MKTKNLPPKDILLAMTGASGLSGGIANANLNVLHALVDFTMQRGMGLTVYSYLEELSDRPDFLPEEVTFRGFGGNKRRFTLSLLNRISRKTVFIIDHVSLALPMLPFSISGMARVIIFAHGSESWRRLRTINEWSFRSASLCIANSHFTLKKMEERIPKFSGVACPLGLSPNFALTKCGCACPQGSLRLKAVDGKTYQLGERFLLLVARMHPNEREKGHYALLNVLEKVLDEFPDVQMVFAGPGEDQQSLCEVAKEKGLASSVFIPGYLDIETLQHLYRDCYVFAMPSRQEGFGLAYLEAMNYRKACIGCYDQGAEDIILPGETGFLVYDPNNQEELLDVLLTLLRDPELTRQMGQKGFERLHAIFTSQHYQCRLKEQIVKVL